MCSVRTPPGGVMNLVNDPLPLTLFAAVQVCMKAQVYTLQLYTTSNLLKAVIGLMCCNTFAVEA